MSKIITRKIKYKIAVIIVLVIENLINILNKLRMCSPFHKKHNF